MCYSACMDIIPRMPKEPARDFALRFLRHNIVNLHLPPGAMISTTEISERTGVSRTPVREAMQELEKTGVLEIFPQAGSRISYIDYNIIHESSFIRQTIETAVVGQLCESITPEMIERFRDILDAQKRHIDCCGNEGFYDLDHAFHRQIYVAAGRMYTYQTLENCQWHFDRLRKLSFNAVSVKVFYRDHSRLFEAIAARDRRRARMLALRHLTRYLKDEAIIRAKYPQYFSDKAGVAE